MPEEEDEDESDQEEGEQQKEKKPVTLDQFLNQYNYTEEDNETQSILDYLYTIPFTFIAYEDEPESGKPIHLGNSTIQLGRDFGWGTIDCLGEKYSDFIKLKKMLLSSHRRYLQLDTVERYYEQYRTEKLMFRRATKMGLTPPQTK